MPKQQNSEGGELKPRKKQKGDKKTPTKKATLEETELNADTGEDQFQEIIYDDSDEVSEGEAEWQSPPRKAQDTQKEKAEEEDYTSLKDARSEFRRDPAVIEAFRQYNDFVNKTNHTLKGTEKDTADKARIYVNLLVAVEERIVTYYHEYQGGTLPAGTEQYHVTSHRAQRAADLNRNELMRAIKSYLVVLLLDLQAAHPEDKGRRYISAPMRESFPINQDPRVLAEGIMERANRATLEAPLKERTMALARELGQKHNHFLDPEGLSKRLREYFDGRPVRALHDAFGQHAGVLVYGKGLSHGSTDIPSSLLFGMGALQI